MEKIPKIIRELDKTLPKFPDGRIDYSNADTVPVVDVYIKHKSKLLLLKRSDKVAYYPRKWNVISGYLDEIQYLDESALKEVNEETGIARDNVRLIQIKKPYNFVDEELNKTWIVHPVLLELKEEPEIKLDWEHTEYKWIALVELENFDIIPDIKEAVKQFFI